MTFLDIEESRFFDSYLQRRAYNRSALVEDVLKGKKINFVRMFKRPIDINEITINTVCFPNTL